MTGSEVPSAKLSCGFCSQETTSSVCMAGSGMGLHGDSDSQLIQPSQKSHGTQQKLNEPFLSLFVYRDSAVIELLFHGNFPPLVFPFFPSFYYFFLLLSKLITGINSHEQGTDTGICIGRSW